MDFFSQACKPGEESELDPHLKLVVQELRDAGYESQVFRPPEGFPLDGPLLRIEVSTRVPSRPQEVDIRRQEFVLLGNWRGYPDDPPSVRLDRIDFPRGLPHINQTKKTDPVWPCLTLEPITDWFQDRSIGDLVALIEQWLSDAIAGHLMAGDQHTFEPIFVPLEREYSAGDRFYVDRTGYAVLSVPDVVETAERLGAGAPPKGVLRARFVPLHSQVSLQPPVVALDTVLSHGESWSDNTQRFDFFGAIRSGVHRSSVLPGLVIFLEETDTHVGPPPDDFEDLVSWSSRMGGPADIKDQVTACLSAWSTNLVGVTFVVPRPRPVPGTSSRCPHVDSATVLVTAEGVVMPLQTLNPLSPESLKGLSGASTALGRCLLVGGGALGSKFGTNFVRATGSDLDVVDPDIFLEHNLARHDLRRVHVGLSKAEGLADELRRMVPGSTSLGVRSTLQQALWGDRISPANYELTLDMTASPRMGDVLAHFLDLPRVFSGFMILRGRYGIAIMEGPERNPRSDDLSASLYALATDHEVIREWLCSSDERVMIGYGACADIASVVSDDDISVHAGRYSRLLRTDALSETGGIWICDVTGPSTHVPIGETTVLEAKGWIIRLTAPARSTIEEALEQHKPKEVAGYLHGVRDRYRKQVIVSHASLEPLIMQTRVGVEIDTSRYENPFGETLEYLGSWHTHPAGGAAPSPTDEGTIGALTDLEAELGRPLVFVIAAPGELAMLVRD